MFLTIRSMTRISAHSAHPLRPDHERRQRGGCQRPGDRIDLVGVLRAVSTSGFTPSFAFPTIAAIAIVATVIGGTLIATIVPALRVSRASIVAAIRQD